MTHWRGGSLVSPRLCGRRSGSAAWRGSTWGARHGNFGSLGGGQGAAASGPDPRRRLADVARALPVHSAGIRCGARPGRPLRPPDPERDRLRELEAGQPAERVGVSGGGDPSIQGFATDISVDHGETVHFKIDTPSTAYHLDIYRMGYYGGDGARKAPLSHPRRACRRPSPTASTTRPRG